MTKVALCLYANCVLNIISINQSINLSPFCTSVFPSEHSIKNISNELYSAYCFYCHQYYY